VRTIPINHGSAPMRARAAPPACLAQRAIPATRINRRACHPALMTTTMAHVTERGWSREFEDPIALPDGRQLVTLEDAGGIDVKKRSATFVVLIP
jgi:hypothetical protein